MRRDGARWVQTQRLTRRAPRRVSARRARGRRPEIDREESMRQAMKLLGWSLIVGLLVVGAFFAGRHVPGDGLVAAAGAPAAARGELARMGSTADAAGAPV